MELNSFRGRGSLIFEDAAAFLGRETKKTVSQRKAVFSSSYFFTISIARRLSFSFFLDKHFILCTAWTSGELWLARKDGLTT